MRTFALGTSKMLLAGLAIAGGLFASAVTATAQSPALTATLRERVGDRAPRVYFVPMRGQMGTDIHPSVYRDVAKDIRSQDPDLIVFMLNGSDPEDGVIDFRESDWDPTDRSLMMIAEYREIIEIFRDQLRDVPQVMWVENSVGFSSLMALAWPDMFMQSDARLTGLGRVMGAVMGWQDVEVRAKMMAAWVGIINGFLERGGYPLEIGDAMMRPEKFLSVSFRGRAVTWSADTDGHWVIDGNDKGTAAFGAQLAEDVGLTRGIADTRDDLLFLLGFREFEAIDDSEVIVERYLTDWRRAWENSQRWAQDYADALRWATGGEEVRQLGSAIQSLERISGAMRRYEAVAIKWQMTTGLDATQIGIMIDEIRERIRALRQRGGNTGGGGRGIGGGVAGQGR